MRPDSATHAYIGRCPCCGNVPAVSVDVPEDAKRTAKYVAEMVRSGLSVERIPLSEVKGIQLRRCAKREAEDEAKRARKVRATQGALI
jgi:hypothetical protein